MSVGARGITDSFLLFILVVCDLSGLWPCRRRWWGLLLSNQEGRHCAPSTVPDASLETWHKPGYLPGHSFLPCKWEAIFPHASQAPARQVCSVSVKSTYMQGSSLVTGSYIYLGPSATFTQLPGCLIVIWQTVAEHLLCAGPCDICGILKLIQHSHT